MGVKHNQSREIPPQYDPVNTRILLTEEFKSSVGDIHEQAKADHIRDHNHTVSQMDLEGSALTNGRRALAHKHASDSQAIRRKREKEERVYRTLLKQFLDRLEDIFRQIEAINQRLDEIETEIHELERLQKLAEDGMLDPNNPAHAQLLKKYGITKEDIDSGNLSLILAEKLGMRVDERTELQQRKEALQREAQEAIAEASVDETISPEEAQQFKQRLQSLEVGVSSQIRITAEASQELKDIAIDHHSGKYDGDVSTNELDFSLKSPSFNSVAASLDGEEATYKKGIEVNGRNISMQDEFAAKVKITEEVQLEQGIASISRVPGLKPG